MNGQGDTPRVARRPVRVPVVLLACSFAAVPDAAAQVARARLVSGVERIGAALKAVEPIVWEDDRAWLTFGDADPHERTGQAWRAAVELWQRCAIDLDLSARIALALVAHGPGELSAEGSTARMDLVALIENAPDRAVVVSEEAALALGQDERANLAVLSATTPNGASIYAFPADAKGAHPISVLDQLSLWSVFQDNAQSSEIREVRYVGFRLPRRAPPALELLEVFVEPSAAEPHHDDHPALFAKELHHWLASHRHLVVLGEPGAGKTTLLRWLALVAALGQWPVLTGEVGPRLPLLVSVGRLAEIMTSASGGAGERGPEQTLAAYFVSETGETQGALARFLARQLAHGRCALLLDGLDEVRSEHRRAVEAWLAELGMRWPENVFIATSRFVGYSGLRLPDDARVVQLAPFGARARVAYVHAFCRAYVRWESGEDRPAEADAQANALLSAIDASDRLAMLAQNPFMLSALALIHRAEGRLPRHRVQAYEMFLRALCETWAEARKLVPVPVDAPALAYEEEAIPILGALALAMHEEHPRGVAPRDFVRRAIASALRARDDIDEAVALAATDAFLERAAGEVQVLLERGADQWGFLHLTFQEFFVAAGLHANEQFDEMATRHLLEPRWEEVIRLGAGYLSLVQKRPVATQRFVEKVLAWKAPAPWTSAVESLGRHIGMAALIAMEAGDALPPRTQHEVAKAFAGWLCEGAVAEAADSMFDHRKTGAATSRWLRQLSLSDFAKPLIAAFLERLHAPGARAKERAADALLQLNARIPAEALAGALSDVPDLPARAVAPLLAQSAPVGELIRLLQHPEERVRVAVVAAARQRGGAEMAAVVDEASKDPSPLVRVAALEPTGVWTGWPTSLSKEWQDRLLASLADPAGDVRNLAVSALERVESQEVTAALVRLAESDPSDDVQQSAAALLGRQGSQAGFEVSLAAHARHAGEPGWDFGRSVLAFAPHLSARLPRLLEALRSPESALRATAAFVLGEAMRQRAVAEFPRREEIEALLVACAGDPDPVVRTETLRGLDVRGDSAFGAAVAATADPDPAIRLVAFEATKRRGFIVELFTRGLGDPDPDVRAFCLSVLPVLPLEDRLLRLEVALSDTHPRVRAAAAGLLHTAQGGVDDLLRRGLADPDSGVRSAALFEVVNRRASPLVDAIAPLLDDPVEHLRRPAVRALALAGDEGARVLAARVAERPEAVVGLWQWAAQRGFAFPPEGP